jgi:hypothetical protein
MKIHAKLVMLLLKDGWTGMQAGRQTGRHGN